VREWLKRQFEEYVVLSRSQILELARKAVDKELRVMIEAGELLMRQTEDPTFRKNWR